MSSIQQKRIGTTTITLADIVLEYNYRKNFSISDVKELGVSIKKSGQLQPIIINQVTDDLGNIIRYELVAGQRRYLALTLIGAEDTRAVVYNNLTPEEVSKIQFSENIKKDIGTLARAESMPLAKKIIEDEIENDSISINTFAKKVHIGRSTAQKAFLYQRTIPDIKELVQKEKLSYSKAVEIGRLPDKEQKEIYRGIISRRLKGSAKELGVYITEKKEELERRNKNKGESIELKLKATKTNPSLEGEDKAKEYSNKLEQASNYLITLTSFLIERPKETIRIINATYLRNYKLKKILEELPSATTNLEEKIKKYNPEKLKQALDPTKGEKIWDFVKRTRQVNGNSINDLLANAEEQTVLLEDIERDPSQPRKTDTKEYEEYVGRLAENIAEIGVVTPIILKPHHKKKKKYILVVGETRWRSSNKAEQKDIPAFIVDVDRLTSYIMQLEEDLYRKDSPAERAQALYDLMKDKKKGAEFSEEEFRNELKAYLGMKPKEVTDYMKVLLMEGTYTRKRFFDKSIGFSTALELTRIKDYHIRDDLCKIIISENLKPRKVKELISNTIQTEEWYKQTDQANSENEATKLRRAINKMTRSQTEMNILQNMTVCLEGTKDSMNKLPETHEKIEDDYYKGFSSNKRLLKNFAEFTNSLKGLQDAMKEYYETKSR